MQITRIEGTAQEVFTRRDSLSDDETLIGKLTRPAIFTRRGTPNTDVSAETIPANAPLSWDRGVVLVFSRVLSISELMEAFKSITGAHEDPVIDYFLTESGAKIGCCHVSSDGITGGYIGPLHPSDALEHTPPVFKNQEYSMDAVEKVFL